MTVLHVVPARPFGGMQRIAALLAAAQRRSGLDAHVLAIYDSAEFLDLLERYDVPHTFLHGSRPNFRAVRHCHQVLARDWSVVHVHGGLLWSNTVALFAKRSPIVYHAHNYPSLDGSVKTRVLNRVNRSLVDVVIAVSKDVARAWRVAGLGSAVECIYNAVELPNAAKPDRLPRLTQSPLFGMATRLAKDKGIFEFLDVAEMIHAQRPGARFVIAGEGPERSKLEEETNRRGLTGVFFLPGYIRDLDAFWSHIDIALFTAPKEPFGLRIVEAMARGVAVAAYLTGAGSDEILCSGLTAVTAKYGDVPSLAENALALCDDSNLYNQITAAAYEDIKTRFSTAAMRDGVACMYDWLTGSVTNTSPLF
jgi:glycosyltransferase involved in cell wall biosynthesis